MITCIGHRDSGVLANRDSGSCAGERHSILNGDAAQVSCCQSSDHRGQCAQRDRAPCGCCSICNDRLGGRHVVCIHNVWRGCTDTVEELNRKVGIEAGQQCLDQQCLAVSSTKSEQRAVDM